MTARVHLRAKGGMNSVCGVDYPNTLQEDNAITEDPLAISCTECVRWWKRQNKTTQISERHGWRLVTITHSSIAICAGCGANLKDGEEVWLKNVDSKWVRYHKEHPPWL